MTPGRVSRRSLLAGAGLLAGSALAGDLIADHLREAGTLAAARAPSLSLARVPGSGYVPDGVAGLAAAFPRPAVRLLDSPFRANSRTQHQLPAVRRPRPAAAHLPAQLRPAVGGPAVRRVGAAAVRGARAHHGAPAVGARPDLRRHGEPGGAGQRSLPGGEPGPLPGAGPAGRLPRGLPVGLPRDLLRPAGGRPARLVAVLHDPQVPGGPDRPVRAGRERSGDRGRGPAGDWVCWRTGRLSYAHMQRILVVEYGGIAEALANLYRLTGQSRYLAAARRFDDAACSARWRPGRTASAGCTPT